MTTTLQNKLRKAAKEDLVYERQFGDLFIYVYTQNSVVNRIWNNITKAARGLILDKDGNIVARPFNKFFNLFERWETEPNNLPIGNYFVEEKLDGSLGIIFFHDGKWNISTKGSLGSDQANYAREYLLPKYDFSKMDPNETILTEIIYPTNRIVVDYGDFEGLRLLAVRNKHTGHEQPAGRIPILADQMHMSCRETYDNNLLSGIVGSTNIEDLPFHEGTEGFICRWSNGFRVKIKNPWYLTIHKALDMRSQKKILDMIEGKEYRSVLLSLPKELQVQFDDIYSHLRTMMWDVERQMMSAWDSVKHMAKESRRDFALEVNKTVDNNFKSAMFSLLDGYTIEHHVFKVVRSKL